jgi:Na+/proline symporter
MLEGIDYIIIGFYLLLMIGIGLLVSSKIRQFKDYFLAGGALTTPLLVCTLVSTYYELDVTFTTSEVGYESGLVAWFWLSRPYYLAIFIAALVIARRLKKFQFLTLPDILEHHYGKWARASGALACFIYSLPITAMAGMTAMFGVLGWPVGIALPVAVGVCALYTLMGGLWADAITDTVQFVLMCVSLAIVIPIALEKFGGFPLKVPAGHMTQSGGIDPWLLVAWCTGALTVFVEPAFYQRIFAAKDTRTVTRALLIGIFLWAAYDWGVTLIGMIARSAVESGVLPTVKGKEALMTICMLSLPVGLKGLFIAGVLAAAMSSVDSYGLLASGNLTYDIYRPLVDPKIDDRRLILLTRIGVLVVMVVAAAMSLLFEKMQDIWVFMTTILTSVVFVPIMGALYGRPSRAAGLLALAGGLVALIIFYAFIYAFGVYEEESYVWRVAGMQIWREYAVLFSLPVSFLGFLIGQVWKSQRS